MSPEPDKARCEQAEWVSLYVLRALPADEAPAVEAHLSACPECRRELDTLRPIIDSFTSWPTEVLRPPESLWERLTQRIAAETSEPLSPAPEPSAAVPEPSAPAPEPWPEPEWKEVAPGICCKLLANDVERDRLSMLVRLGPGVEYPPHAHAGVEEVHLLHGELWINDRKLRAGDYNRAEPGSVDRRVWSETGCTCVLVTSALDRIL